jgi:hypothetical protein
MGHPTDQIRVKMAAPVLDKIKDAPTCAYVGEDAPSAEDLVASYQSWLETYISDAKRIFGVYRPAASGKWDIAVCNPPSKASGFLRRALVRYTFFPHTKAPSCAFASDSEAILNDWAIVGTDLFRSMQQYKIVASHVADPKSAERPATTSTSR